MKNGSCNMRVVSLLPILGQLLLIVVTGCSSQVNVSGALGVKVSTASLTIHPGEQSLPLTVTSTSTAYQDPIIVTVSGLPSGITATDARIMGGGTGTIYLSASLAAGQEGFNSGQVSQNTAFTTQVNVLSTAGGSQLSTPLNLTISISNPSFAPSASSINLPVVTIDTSGTPVTSTVTDVPGNVTITSANGQSTYLNGTATFHVHGNSTANMPKLPYKVKLDTSVDLLGSMGLQCPYVTGSGNAVCDKSKSYVLLANYDDKTLLRDWAASALANAIPYDGDYLTETAVPSSDTGTIPTPSGTSTLMPWAPHSLFVELYLNGEYEGNYQLIEEVKVDSHRVNINELAETDTKASKITGGYLMEIDHTNGEAYMFNTPQGVDIGLVDPDFTPDPEVPQQTAYITSYMDTAENALFSSNFTDPTLGWRAYFDEASAVNYYIVMDVMGNVDGGSFWSSDYLYKDENNPFIYMGPVWDFDVSSGNINYATIVNPTLPWMQTQAPWYAQWFRDPGFKADVGAQWNALQKNGVFANWITSIRTQASTLEQSQVNNYNRWPMLGLEVWPNPEAAGNYDGEVNYLVNWLNLRIAYLDSQFNNKAQTETKLAAPSDGVTAGFPVTLTAMASGSEASLTGSISFLCNGVLVGTAPLVGNSASLTINGLPAGADSLQAVYSGDVINALSVSDPQPTTVAALRSTSTRRTGPVLPEAVFKPNR